MYEFNVHESQPEADPWGLGAGIGAEYHRNKKRIRGLDGFHQIINSGTQPVVPS